MQPIYKLQGLFFLSVFIFSFGITQAEDIPDTRKISGLKWILNQLAAQPHLLTEFKEKMEMKIGRTIELEPFGDPVKDTCGTCKFTVSLLKFLTIFLDYDDIRLAVHWICPKLLGNVDGDTMCAQLVDNYGYHVTHIIKATRSQPHKMSAKEICTFLNHCEEDKITSTTTMPDTTPGPTEKETPEAPTSTEVPKEEVSSPSPTTTDKPAEATTIAELSTTAEAPTVTTAEKTPELSTTAEVPKVTTTEKTPELSTTEGLKEETSLPTTTEEPPEMTTVGSSSTTENSKEEATTGALETTQGQTEKATTETLSTTVEGSDSTTSEIFETASTTTAAVPEGIRGSSEWEGLYISKTHHEHNWKEREDFLRKILSSNSISKHTPMTMYGAPPRRNLLHEQRRKKRHAKKLESCIKIAQVTDFHVDIKYAEGGAVQCDLPVCCRNDSNAIGNSTARAGKWGESAYCNIPARTSELFLRFVKEQNPHFVIYSGDNPPHSAWEETMGGQLDMVEWSSSKVTEIITRELSISAYPAIGNHETMPTNLYSMIEDVHGENMTEFNRFWYESWKEAAGFEEEQEETIKKAGYYTIPVKLNGIKPEQKLRIVCLNSNYGYTDNWYNLIQMDRPEVKEMIKWFSDTLATARKANEKVIILTHHDVGSFENIIRFDEWFTKVLAEYKDIVVLHPVGHTHRDEFRLYFDSEDYDKPAGIVHVGMTMNSWPQVNPGFRIFYLDSNNFEVVDYDQYIIDLKEVSGGADQPEPKLLYRFTEEYDTKDASAQSFMDLWNRMRTDRALMEKYWLNRRSQSGVEPEMSDEQWKSELCHGVGQSYRRYRDCMEIMEVVNATTTAVPTTSTTTVTTTTDSGASILRIAPVLFCVMILSKLASLL